VKCGVRNDQCVTGTVRVTRASLGTLSPLIAPVPMTKLPRRVWSQWHRDLIRRGYLTQDIDEEWASSSRTMSRFCTVAGRKRDIRGYVFPGGWRISGAAVGARGARAVSADLNRVVHELVLCAIVFDEPTAGLRAELVRLSMPPDCPAPPAGAIEHSVLGLRSDQQRRIPYKDTSCPG